MALEHRGLLLQDVDILRNGGSGESSRRGASMKLFIDTDPGVDDALAILMALADPRVDLVGLGIAAGNVGLGHTLRNALKLLEVCRRDVPVFPGCPCPLLQAAPDAGHVHGSDGFGDTGYEAPGARPADEHAALALLRLSHRHAGELVVVALAPLTNLALALRLDPSLPQRIRRLVVMGGAVTGRGNITPMAEFNAYFDAEAAKIVLEEWPDYELVDWEAVMRHSLDRADVDRWLAADSARAAFFAAISRYNRDSSFDRRRHRWLCADALAMAVALEPEAALESRVRAVQVDTGNGPCRGVTAVDWGQRSGARESARILMNFDQSRFEARLREALAAR